MKKTLSLVLVLIISVSAMFGASVSAYAAQYKEVKGKYNYSYASQVLDLVNKERKNYGLSELTLTQSLTDSAMLRAVETTVSFSHTRPNGEKCFTAFEWSRAAGENIAYGQRSPEQVVNAWMNSSGHRANILSTNFTTIGIGCFEYGGTYYWSQAFSGGTGKVYTASGTKSVTVNVSLTAGAQSYVAGSETTTQSETTTRISTTTEQTTRQAVTKPSVTAPQTTKPQTTNRPSQSTRQSLYEIIRSFFARYKIYI